MTAASDPAISNGGKVHNVPLCSVFKKKLTEKDLLKMCVDYPKYLSKALGHDVKTEGTLQTLEEKKEMLKYFWRAWSALGKFIYS